MYKSLYLCVCICLESLWRRPQNTQPWQPRSRDLNGWGDQNGRETSPHLLPHFFIFVLWIRFIYPKNKNNIKIISKCIDKGRCTIVSWTFYSSSVEWVDRLLVADQILASPWFFQCGLHPAAAGLGLRPRKEVPLPFALRSPTKAAITCQEEGPKAPSPPHEEAQAVPFCVRGCVEGTHSHPRNICVMHTTHAHACTHTHTNIRTHKWKSKMFFPEWDAPTPLP